MKSFSILMAVAALTIMLSLQFLHGRETDEPGSPGTQRETPVPAALYLAVQHNDAERVRLLIANGADPNLQLPTDVQNWAPLHWAARFDTVEAAKALLTAGADVDFLAMPPPQAEIFGPLPGHSPLDIAAEQGSVGVADVLIEAGAKIDANPKKSTRSALHCAVSGLYRTRDASLRLNKLGKISFGNSEMIELLLEEGASLKQKDYRGNLPLHVATHWYAADTISYLLDKHRDQIDIDAEGEFQRTPLLMAVEGAIHHRPREDVEPIRREVIRLLVEHGADPNLESGLHGDMTPLEAARRKGLSAEIIKLLTKQK